VIARSAGDGRVYFVEDPVFQPGITAQLHIERAVSFSRVLPHLPSTLAPDDITAAQRRLVNQLIRTERIRRYLLWYSASTPLCFTDHLRPLAVIYDCSAERPAGERVSATYERVDPLLMRQAALLVVNGQPLRQRGRNRSSNVLRFTSAQVSWDREADGPIDRDAPAQHTFLSNGRAASRRG
jgi:UDP-galactopyranose mutase